MAKEKIKILGEKGFIGSNLTILLKDSFEIVDNFEEADVIINCVGRIPKKNVTFTDYFNSNVIYVRDLIDKCWDNHKPLIHLSTKAIDFIDAPIEYTKTKEMGDFLIKESTIDWIILKLPHVYGGEDYNGPLLGMQKIIDYAFITEAVQIGNLASTIKKLIEQNAWQIEVDVCGDYFTSDQLGIKHRYQGIKIFVPKEDIVGLDK